ncbi:MAG TPA: P-loop NTPase fold protein, partial [Candidatus Dormibacteraeota bacterium]|nr:P-loop NTPase fold protein [Candidatus Dormibacteraeota bacterium]
MTATPPSGLGRLSLTVQALADRFGDRPVSAGEIVTAIVELHANDPGYGGGLGYAGGRAQQLLPEWPPAMPRRQMPDWLIRVGTLWRDAIWTELFGAALMLGLALRDPATGRAMEATGLFHQLATELQPPLTEALSEEGQLALESLPLAAATAGRARPDERRVTAPGRPIALSDDSRVVVTVREDGTPVAWDARRAELRPFPSTPSTPPTGVWANRDGSRIVVGYQDGRVELRSMRQLDPVELPASSGVVAWSTFSADDRLVAVVSGSAVSLYGTETPPFYHPQQQQLTYVVIAGDRLLAAGRDGTVQVWDMRSGNQVSVLNHSVLVLAMAAHPSGTFVAVGDENGAVWLWTEAASVASAIVQHGEPVRALSFSPDGTLLASGGDDGNVKLWRVPDLTEVGRLPHGQTHIRDVAFDPSGTELQTIAEDGVTRRWTIAVEQPLAPAYVADQVAPTPGRIWIDEDVDAFARLIASRHMAPPLSIAVFGDWGSGKTFFMRRLRDRVAELATGARASGLLQREVGYYKHIAQVEFNAWHYANADLWASLVDNLFTQLWIAGDPPHAARKRVEALFGEMQASDAAAARAASMEVQWLEEERRVADQRRMGIENREAELRQDLEKVRSEQRKAVDQFRRKLKEATRAALDEAGYPDLGTTPAQALDTLRKARQVADEARLTAAVLLARDRRRRLALLVAAILLPSAVAVAIHLAAFPLAGLKDALAGLAGVVGVAASVVAWLQRQADWLRRFRTALAPPVEGLERARDRLDAAKATAEHELTLVEARLAEARDRSTVATKRLEARAEEMRSGNPAALLARLIGDRAESDYYRRHLGLLALVRRDFEALSEFVEADRLHLEQPIGAEDEAAGEASRVNRIVLYIDDLDRCPPDVVVRVLEAIHLLLSFPLFVVVVGVDVRWVSRALTLKYPDLLHGTSDGAASPGDYLEKIFQVPYWVEPLEPAKTRQLLQSLLERRLDAAAPEPDGAPEQP